MSVRINLKQVNLALTYAEYRASAKKVKLIEVSSEVYYGKVYQDVQHRVPRIDNTCRDLDWKPSCTFTATRSRKYGI